MNNAPKRGEVKRIANQMGLDAIEADKLLQFAELFFMRGRESMGDNSRRDAFIVASFKSGQTMPDIARTLVPPLSYQCVQNIIKKAGLKKTDGGRYQQAVQKGTRPRITPTPTGKE